MWCRRIIEATQSNNNNLLSTVYIMLITECFSMFVFLSCHTIFSHDLC